MSTVRSLLNTMQQSELYTIAPDATVYQALEMMRDKAIWGPASDGGRKAAGYRHRARLLLESGTRKPNRKNNTGSRNNDPCRQGFHSYTFYNPGRMHGSHGQPPHQTPSSYQEWCGRDCQHSGRGARHR